MDERQNERIEQLKSVAELMRNGPWIVKRAQYPKGRAFFIAKRIAPHTTIRVEYDMPGRRMTLKPAYIKSAKYPMHVFVDGRPQTSSSVERSPEAIADSIQRFLPKAKRWINEAQAIVDEMDRQMDLKMEAADILTAGNYGTLSTSLASVDAPNASPPWSARLVEDGLVRLEIKNLSPHEARSMLESINAF